MNGRTWLAVLVLVMSASTAQAKLEIKDLQAAYGPLLPVRQVPEYYAQDLIYFRYLITGASTDEKGQVDVEAVVKLTDANGKEVYNQKTPYRGTLSLGGNAFAAAVYIPLTEQFLSGDYTLSVAHTDFLTAEKAAFQTPIKIKSTEFAVVLPRFSYDPDGRILAPAGGMLNQALFFRIGVIGFDRSHKRVDLASRVEVLDATGKEAQTRPLETVIKEDDAKVVEATQVAYFNGSLGLHRPGEFRLRITVTDRLAGKSHTIEFPLRVVAP